MSVWSRGTFSALALRRSVAHIPLTQTEAHWLERSRSNNRQPIECCDSAEGAGRIEEFGNCSSRAILYPLFPSFVCMHLYHIYCENIHTITIRETYPFYVCKINTVCFKSYLSFFFLFFKVRI